ncbi:hypothetical protein GJ744_007478 [Endocarpon pusillum]|uniref:ribonuclease Z n=1 Tax=Endocarpon pusillum TaxID=364733 RepID=A0A8H7AIN9_9EURO|nr:hypothetical protein GJ744_007478 [Endocarpon pusillum]
MGRAGASRKKFYFQFITTPTADTAGTSLLLHFDDKRYIFGDISEGTQRACVQRGIGLKKVKHIFLSGTTTWNNTGGLIGMVLTMADAQAAERESDRLRFAGAATSTTDARISQDSKEQSHFTEGDALTIHGGERLLHMLACCRSFVLRKGLPVSVNEIEHSNEPNLDGPTWSDENIRVWAMPIAPSVSEASESDEAETSDGSASSAEGSFGTNGRKRSHDQFTQGDDGSILPGSPDQHQRHQKLRQRIVTDMFNSNWNRDALFETPLADVKMPAAMFVRDPETKRLTSYAGPRPGDGHSLPNIKVLVRHPWPNALVDDLPPVRNIGFKPAMSYIVQGYPQRGKFDIRKAQALGVPEGPSYSSLAAGNSVTLEDGTIVTSDMVLGPTKPSRGIAIIELPSARYVENLIRRPEWTSDKIRNGVAAICWILAPGVIYSSTLRMFMKSMPDVEHIISSAEVCPNYLSFDSSAASTVRLSRICRNYFPVPFHDNATLPQFQTSLDEFAAADRGLKVQIEPEFLISKDEIPPFLNIAEVVKDLPIRVQQYASIACQQVATEMAFESGSDAQRGHEYSEYDPEIITLGTGSALPSKYRNVSATLLRTGRYGNFLFDCGENTIGQLRRIFDGPELGEVLRNLKFIWLSHGHADHHLGTISVLLSHRHACKNVSAPVRRKKGTNAPHDPTCRVVVASGSKLLQFLEEYESVEKLGNVEELLCQRYEAPISDNSGEKANSLLQKIGINRLRTTHVEHCHGAQAIAITFANGFKFSYSGDCRPSLQFARIGKDSDVLIHEATFDDDMQGDALAKKHSTTGEALGVAAKMEAKNLILTHFSQRYQKLPVMENIKLPSSMKGPPSDSVEESLATLDELHEAGRTVEDAFSNGDSEFLEGSEKLVEWTASGSDLPKADMNIGVAFDYMRVRVSDIKHMKTFTPALAALFEAEQTNLGHNDASPQAKNDMINRAKASKKTQQSMEIEKQEPRMSGTDRVSSRTLQNSLEGPRHDTKIESEEKSNLPSKVLHDLAPKSHTKAVVTTAADGPIFERLPPSDIRPNHPP